MGNKSVSRRAGRTIALCIVFALGLAAPIALAAAAVNTGSQRPSDDVTPVLSADQPGLPSEKRDAVANPQPGVLPPPDQGEFPAKEFVDSGDAAEVEALRSDITRLLVAERSALIVEPAEAALAAQQRSQVLSPEQRVATQVGERAFLRTLEVWDEEVSATKAETVRSSLVAMLGADLSAGVNHVDFLVDQWKGVEIREDGTARAIVQGRYQKQRNESARISGPMAFTEPLRQYDIELRKDKSGAWRLYKLDSAMLEASGY